MGERGKRGTMMFAWTRTVGDLIEAGAEVTERCPGCATNTILDLEEVREERGALYTFWNRHPPCPAVCCGQHLTYIAALPGSGTWPVHMTGGESGEVEFMEATWRADRLTSDMGGRLALQVMIGLVRNMTRWGMFTVQEQAALVHEAVATLPPASREDGAWLLTHYLERGTDRPGWR